MKLTIYNLIQNTGKGKNNKLGEKMRNSFLYNGYKGQSKTISNFYDDFILNRLPDYNVVKKWHEMLLEYCKMPNAVFAIRSGRNAGSLRRGWLTHTNQGYSFLFSDNDLATTIYKIVLDGYCPTKDEFYELMTSADYPENIPWLSKKRKIANSVTSFGEKRKFYFLPVHFDRFGGKTYPDKYEGERNAFIIGGPVCCLSRSKYKHSHIFNAGTGYLVNNEVIGMKKICEQYFTLGDVDDYVWDKNLKNYVRNNYIIPDDKKDEYKSLIIACFLRFIDPLNHFLAPSTEGYLSYTDNLSVVKNDIAEYIPLLDHIKTKFEGIYSSAYYDAFLKVILAEKNYISTSNNVIINAVYDSSKKVSSSKPTATTTVKTVASSSTSIKTNQGDIKVGQYARMTFVELLETNSLSKAQIDNLKDKVYCSKHFGITFPLLVEHGKDQYDDFRYYKNNLVLGKYLISSQWYERNRVKLEKWLDANGFSVKSVGQYAKNKFKYLLESNKLSNNDICNLKDLLYCKDNFGICYPVIVEKGTSNYDYSRYYKKDVILGKYLICSQWYNRHKKRLDTWFKQFI